LLNNVLGLDKLTNRVKKNNYAKKVLSLNYSQTAKITLEADSPFGERRGAKFRNKENYGTG